METCEFKGSQKEYRYVLNQDCTSSYYCYYCLKGLLIRIATGLNWIDTKWMLFVPDVYEIIWDCFSFRQLLPEISVFFFLKDNMAFFRCNAHETYLYFPKNHMHARHFIAKLSWGRHSSVGVAVEISFSLFFLATA